MLNRLLIILLCLSIPAQSLASVESSQKSPFDSWVSLTKYMRSVGIEPTRVDWLFVEQLCAGQLEYGQLAYNQCRFEKAQLSVLHAQDLRECRVVARSDYPEDLRKNRRLLRRVSLTSDGDIRQTDYRTRGISKRQLTSHRRAGVVRCMKDLGWISAKNWRFGQR